MTLVRLLHNAGLIRLWCFRCARGGTMSPEAMKRYWTCDLRTWRPICKRCRRDDQTIALPATDPWFAEDGTPANARSLVVEQFFHDMRARRKRGPGMGR